MSLLLTEENSWKMTLHWQSISGNNLISIPVKREIEINSNQHTAKQVVGIVGRYDIETKKFEFPNGSSIQKNVVTNWYVVPPYEIQSWNQASDQAERQKKEIKIPYEIILVEEIQIVER